VLCWGANNEGQLGNGTGMGSNIPVQVEFEGAPLAQVSAIDAGLDHTCAIRGPANGQDVICWGASDNFRSGPDNNNPGPQEISFPGVTEFAAVATGNTFSCVVGTAGNRVFCWGENARGQSGQPSQNDVQNPLVVLTAGGGAVGGANSLDLGGAHGCVSRDTDVLCWGGNGRGQVGINSMQDQFAAQPVNVPVDRRSRVVLGAQHTCIVGGTGEIHCWGLNGMGQSLRVDGGMTLPTPMLADVGPAIDQGLWAGFLTTCVALADGPRCFGQREL
ncbi:MAG: hypothetical protein AAGF12_26430, partial [Myxococcota bacterium]